jgi:hypothetical protein
MGCAGIDHQLEGPLLLLEAGDERSGVLEHDIVVGHAVEDQQRIGDPAGIPQHARGLVRFRIDRRVAEEAFGIMGIVQLPTRHRRSRNAGGVGAGGRLQQLERHVAAIGPAVDRDAIGIDEVLALQPLNSRQLVGHFDAAELEVKFVGELPAPPRRSAAINREDDPAFVHQILLERVAPGTHHLPA